MNQLITFNFDNKVIILIIKSLLLIINVIILITFNYKQFFTFKIDKYKIK